MEYIIKFIVIGIPILIIYFLFKRISYIIKYSFFIENEYKNLIDLLYSSTDSQRQEILKKARKTSLYNKIKWENTDGIEKFIMLNNGEKDENDFD